MHWLFGMVYVFYFASFVLLLREVLRPGVLWFLRNLNDPDYNPVQEVCQWRFKWILRETITSDWFYQMIQLPIAKHVRRFLFSGILFGTTTLLMVWVPIRIIKKLSPTFLPYNFTFTTYENSLLSILVWLSLQNYAIRRESTNEMSLELVLLQVFF